MRPTSSWPTGWRSPRALLSRSGLQNLLLAVASAALTLAATEALARLLEWRKPPQEAADYIADWDEWDSDFFTARGWGGSSEFNRDGLRDRQHALAKPAGARRLVFLGDSTTYGHHLRPEEAYPQLLQQRLDALGGGFEVFNGGLSGWATRQQLIAYRRIFRRYAPDQVFLAVCLNDVPDMQNNLSRPSPALAWLFRSSAAVRVALGAGERQIRDVRELFLLQPPPRVQQGYERVFAEIRSLAAEVRADGARFAVLVFPFRFQVEANAPPPLPQQAFARFCEQEGLTFLDLLPAFRSAGRKVFFDEDHFTAGGHRLVAEALLVSGLIEAASPAGSAIERDVTTLAQSLLDESAQQRLRATRALATLGPAAAPALERLLEILGDPGDPSPEVRAAAAWAVGRQGSQAQHAGPALVVRLSDPSEEVRLRAAEALEAIAPDAEQCLPGLIAGLREGPPALRALHARALAAFGSGAAGAAAALLEALQEPDAELRGEAARALGRAGSAVAALAVPALVLALDDPQVRWQAVEALGGFGSGSAPAAPALVAALEDPDGVVRRLASRALGRIGPPARASGPALARVLNDARPDVRQAAARALGRVDPDPAIAVPALERAAQDPHSDVREEAARALERLRRRSSPLKPGARPPKGV